MLCTKWLVSFKVCCFAFQEVLVLCCVNETLVYSIDHLIVLLTPISYAGNVITTDSITGHKYLYLKYCSNLYLIVLICVILAELICYTINLIDKQYIESSFVYCLYFLFTKTVPLASLFEPRRTLSYYQSVCWLVFLLIRPAARKNV